MSNEIKAIVFDLGNVLIDVKYEMTLDRLRPVIPHAEWLYYQFFTDKKYLLVELEMGKMKDEEFVEEIKNFLGVNTDNVTMAKMISEIFIENEELTSLLPILKNKYKLYLLSNTSSLHKEYGWGHYAFLKNFDKLFLSNEIGAIKPMDEIYEYAEKQIGLEKDEFVYIDDITEFVETARNRGWNAIKFRDNKSLFEELKKYNVTF